MDLRSLSEDAPESQWREPMRDKVGAEQLQQVHHCTTQTGGSDCGPDRSAPSGSRRAATGVRNNRGVRSKTVEDHDRRFCHRRPLTWRSSHVFTVLNTTQFHVRILGTDLARRKPGVQIPSPPPHHRTSSGRMGPSGSGALIASLDSRVPSLFRRGHEQLVKAVTKGRIRLREREQAGTTRRDLGRRACRAAPPRGTGNPIRRGLHGSEVANSQRRSERSSFQAVYR